LAVLLTFGLTCFGMAAELRVELAATTRSADDVSQQVEAAVRHHARVTAQLSDRVRLARGDRSTFFLPLRVVLTRNGEALPFPSRTRNGGGLSLSFESSGPRAFPTEYRTLLENLFTNATPTLDAVFGTPNQGGTVKVLNFDGDIQARLAVAGGYYVANAPGGPEIRFPIYQSAASASVNFVHCLLLAYRGSATTPFDAWNDGLVRAATMQVVRTPGVVPVVTSEQIEGVLDSLYDVSSLYDWSNHPGLGAPTFIAPNLLNTPIPPGGSTGGAFLLRYQMAGTAFAKVLAQYPGFAAEFNRNFYASPLSYQTSVQLETLAQTALNNIQLPPGATVEGLPFAEWAERQAILDVAPNAGLKLVPQAFPIDPTPGSSDFGVFGIVLNAFLSDPLGNETLLGGRSYPLYWRPEFVRFFTTSQDDILFLGGGYGAVAPNFPGATFGGAPYRVTVDLPYQGRVARLHLPAGAVATGSNPVPNNFYGVLVGLPSSDTGGLFVSATYPGGAIPPQSIRNRAFGFRVNDPSFDRAQSVVITVRREGVVDPLLTRVLNKGVGPLAAVLTTPDSDATFTLTRPGRLAFLGIPYQPYRPYAPDLLSSTPGATLVARWNSSLGRYDLFPRESELSRGLGYFVRGAGLSSQVVRGRHEPNTPLAVSLQPGWNMVTAPSLDPVALSQVQVTTTTQAMTPWNEGLGILLGNTMFRFVPDPLNLDGGTFQPATLFEPGQAYFVRSLSPEGGVLLFGVGTRQTRLGNVIVPAGNPDWLTSVTLTSRLNHSTTVQIGQHGFGLTGYNPRLDDTMPPAVGGLQATVFADTGYYRKLMPRGRGMIFRIRLDGLQRGERYVLSLQGLVRQQNLQVFDERFNQLVRVDYRRTAILSGEGSVWLRIVVR
jgi:hypothetical protein